MSRLKRVRMRGQKYQSEDRIPEALEDVLKRREWSNAPSIVERSTRMRTENSDRGGAVNCHKSRKGCVAGGVGREEMESGRPGCFAELATGEKTESTVAGRDLGGKSLSFAFCMMQEV